jgi:hypothetical protein
MADSTVKDVLQHSVERNGVQLKDALDDILSDRIAHAIENVSAEIGANLFGAESAGYTEEEVEYDEELIEEVVTNILADAEEADIELTEEELFELVSEVLVEAEQIEEDNDEVV